MIDIISAHQGMDLGVYDTDVEKAKNIFSVQIGALTYVPDFGIDLKFFLSEDFAFQNESFKSYLVQRLTDYSVNVTSILELVEDLYLKLTFNIGTSNQSDTSMIAR